MAWGSISLFDDFLEKDNPLETLVVIFENVSPKDFLPAENELLRNFLQTAALNDVEKQLMKQFKKITCFYCFMSFCFGLVRFLYR